MEFNGKAKVQQNRLNTSNSQKKKRNFQTPNAFNISYNDLYANSQLNANEKIENLVQVFFCDCEKNSNDFRLQIYQCVIELNYIFLIKQFHIARTLHEQKKKKCTYLNRLLKKTTQVGFEMAITRFMFQSHPHRHKRIISFRK